jgi:hypothetical protein
MAKIDKRPTLAERLAALGLERTDLATLAAAQEVSPVDRPEDLLGDFWPEDEKVEDFLRAVEAWQRGEA